VLKGVGEFLKLIMPDGVDLKAVTAVLDGVAQAKKRAAELLGVPVPTRPPGFCVGCPERPVFTALKLIEKELGGIHISSDIGCHTFSTLQPFNLGNTVLGYGLSLAAASAMGPNFGKRIVTVMGDGGFWHQGLDHRRRQRGFPQRRRRAGHHAERLHLGHRHAEHSFLAGPLRQGRQPASPSSPPCAASA
jgi:TPP-dependent indolepyruvate ferredoxin oxidoreductase alpha subunit